MHPEERDFREENRFLASVADRVLRGDPLLQPYFEDGVFSMTGPPEEEFMRFAAAQRDLLASQVSEVEAVINNLTARTALYRLEGTLLARRGLALAAEE